MDSTLTSRKRQTQQAAEPPPEGIEDSQLFRPIYSTVYDSPESSEGESTCDASDELLQRSNEERVRQERWPNALEGLSAAASYVIGLGNIWFFPFLCAKYGGSAFFVPYVTAYVFVGIPMMYIEMALGQYTSMSPYILFDRLCNGLSGIAPAMFAVILYRSLFFSGILSHCLYVGIVALTGSVFHLPWSTCGNSKTCFDLVLSNNCQNEIFDQTATRNFTEAMITLNKSALAAECQGFVAKMYTAKPRIPAHNKYLFKEVVKPVYVIENFPAPYIGGFFTLLLVWIVTAVLCTTGLRTLGKASYVLSIAPVLSVLFIFLRSFTYENSLVGMSYFLQPEFNKILSFGAWSDAVILVLFSLSVGDGGLIKIAMHNQFDNNVMRDVFLVAFLDFTVSLLSGVGFFGMLGELGRLTYPENPPGEAFKLLMVQGESIAFSAFPELVSMETLGWLQVALFYFTLFLLGLQSMVTSMDVLVTSMIDSTGINRYGPGHFYLIAKLCIVGFLVSMFSVIPSGIYLVKLFEIFTSLSLVFICCFEVIAVIYIYGFRRFASNIQSMMGGGKRRLYPFWWANWLFLTPLYLLVALVFTVIDMMREAIENRPVTAGYMFPKYLEYCGLVICATIVMWIPIVLVKKLCNARQKGRPLWTVLTCDSYWGPAETNNRVASRARERAHRVL